MKSPNIKIHSTPYATQRAFTLVETLVAIAVLMIAIAGPLVIASKSLTASLYARDQMIASLLAQESMEIIKNVRSNNIEASPANADAWKLSLDACLINSPCDASSFIAYPYIQMCSTTGCPLYFFGGYTPVAGADQTIFTRYFFLTPAIGANASSEYTVQVVVKWNEGVVPNELRLVSQLTNSKR